MANTYTPIKSAGQQDTLITVNEDEADGVKQEEKTGGIKGAWKWFMAAPLTRWPFLVFIVFALLSVVWLLLYISDTTTGYIVAGVAAVVMSLYGASHFRTLLGLKQEVDQLHKLNNEFRTENTQLTLEVDNLTKAKEQLGNVADNLRMSNEKLKENLKKFQELDEHLKTVADDSVEGLQKLRDSSQGIMSKWKENLIGHEKRMLNKVLDQVEYHDGKANMNKAEFEEFLNRLTEEWRQIFKSKGFTFESVAGEDGEIDFDEFTKMIDEITEEKALK